MSRTWIFDKDSKGEYISNPCGKHGYDKFIGVQCSYDDTNVQSIILTGSTVEENGLPAIKLQGTIHPDLFTNIPSLSHLDLSNNELTGPIPTSCGSHKNIYSLYLEYNKLTGPLPVQATDQDWNFITVLWLGNNHFTGTIPNEYAEIQYLRGLDVADNRLDGTIPASITTGSYDLLQYLFVENNDFTGALPESSYELLYFNAHNNDLEGVVPKYESLSSLGLHGNIKIDVEGSAQNINHTQYLDITITNCNFADSIFGPPRKQFMISNYYDGTSKCPESYATMWNADDCKPLQYCQIDGDTISKWGVVKSGRLTSLVFSGGFQVKFDENAVEALSVNDQFGILGLGPDPLMPRHLRLSFWGGELSLAA
ncbi:MAG: hypothetical protein VXZ58_05520, partial [Actinomycetota bacterium]|nr:hypothetical protein [Actinomycetota bacterium]